MGRASAQCSDERVESSLSKGDYGGSAATMAAPLRGRLMVGRLTLDQVVKVRVLAPQLHKASQLWTVGRFDPRVKLEAIV
jgi:hypothetical protein